MVGGLTFTRPEKWTWEAPPAKSTAATRFFIPAKSGGRSIADVRFYLGTKDPDTAVKLWKTYFPRDTSASPEFKKIGKCGLTFLTLRGTYQSGESKPKTDYQFLGVVMEYANQLIHVRMVGPRVDVMGATRDFTAMVEEAARQATE